MSESVENVNTFAAERKKLGLTQKQLAEKLGVSKNYISDIETGIKHPGVKLVKQMAELTKVEWYKFLE